MPKGVEKQFIHVRINISGSPLEFPGLLLPSTCLLQRPSGTLTSNFVVDSFVSFDVIRNFSNHRTSSCAAPWNSSHSQGDSN